MTKSLIVTVNIPKRFKFNYEQDTCTMIDRSLETQPPATYGYLKDILSDDGDAMDVFILNHGQILDASSQVRVRIIGAIECIENGVYDPKLVAVLEDDDLDEEIIEDSIHQLYNYLGSYKEGVEVEGILDAIQATKLFLDYRKAA